METKYGVQKIITVIWVMYMQKRFKIEFQLTSNWQSKNFSQNCPIFHIFTEIVIAQHLD